MRSFAYLAICALMSSAAAETPPAERVWPGAGVKLEARQGATIEERGDVVYVQTGRCRPNTWPNVAFVYPTPHDLTQARGVRMTFTNCTDRTLRIAIKVKGRTAQDQMPEGGCNLPAHGVCTKELRFFSGGWVFDKDPHLLGLKRNPHVGGGSSRPFAPEFETSCRAEAQRAREWGTNEWCLGWTSNNEQSWGANGAALARGVLASPDDQPAKVALLKMLDVKGMNTNTVTDAVLHELGEAVADKYYATVRAAIKAVAPNHLYLGDRNDKRNPEVFRAAARHLDVITVNVYDFRPTVELPKDAEDKPFLVTEFHFGCYDTGFFYASLIPVEDQRTRAACYLDYLRTVVDSANYVGAHWFCWRDCPITGQLGEGANAQCGLVSTADVPYTELVNAIRTVSGEMYARRYGTLP